MKKVFNKCFIILGVILNIQMVNAQRVALKSNLIDWATLSPNLAVEMRLNQRLTLDISAAANPFSFTIADMKATHFRFQPELRYWFNRPMARHFMGISLLGGLYNVKFKEHLYEGDIWAAGLTYGYAFVLSRHWNMEATLGIGMAKLRGFRLSGRRGKTGNTQSFQMVACPYSTGTIFLLYI